MATQRQPFLSFNHFVISRPNNKKGLAANNLDEPGTQRTDDIVAYDGALACSQKDYNFCHICKEKLEVEQDD